MGVFGEFLIIAATAFAGVLLAAVPGFPFPGSVTGMLLMLLLLLSGIVKLEKIRHAADFFLRFLPLFFVPLIVNLLKEGEILETYGLRLILVIILTTFITMIITGLTAKLMLTILKRRNRNES